MSSTDFESRTQERRDLEARAARDRLAELLGVPPGELRRISREHAEAMAATMLAWEPGGDAADFNHPTT